MQIHGLHQAQGAQSLTRTNSTQTASPVQSAPAVQASTADELDLSAEAQSLSAAQATQSERVENGIRVDKVAELRQAIASGNYETPERMSAALDKMLDTFA